MSFAMKLVISMLLVAFTSASLKDDYSNSAFLDESKKYKLYWKINDTKQIISFAVEVQTLGWVGFGISPGSGNMAGSDVVIGWVKGNKGYLKDRYAKDNSLPAIDTKQDYDLTEAYEQDKKTVLKFSRKYDTCDDNDIKIETGTSRIIYSYHNEDPENEENVLKHTVQGSRSLVLLSVHKKTPTLPNDLKQFEFTVNASLSQKDTTYYCKPFQMPDFKGAKKHVVKISPVVTPGNEGLVHHILVYGCRDDFNVSHLSEEGICHSPNMPDSIQDCAGNAVIAAWAIGGTDFYFPNHVGYPIGDPQSVKFVVMEIHYDNPDKKSGLTDQSGIRFHYTSKHRKYDAGLLWMGWAVTPLMVIPPREKKWNSIGFCPSNCTQVGLEKSPLPDGGIMVFSVFLHSHLLGSSIWAQHIRNGKEMPELARDDHYDFNYQEAYILKDERRILPGDDIIQHCRYDSSKRTKLTTGGASTREEMCMIFLYYYPRVNFTRCMSADLGYRDFVKNYESKNETRDWQAVEWKKEWKDDLSKAYRDRKDVYVLCEKEKGNPLHPVHGKMISKPVITEPWRKLEDCPRDPTSTGVKFSGCVLLFVASVLKSTLLI